MSAGTTAAGRGILRYSVLRCLQAVPLLGGIVMVSFLLLQLTPGDPITALTGDFPVTEEYAQRVRERYGLDRPPLEQLFLYTQALLSGDLGFSFANRQPVTTLIWDRASATLVLMLSAQLIAIVFGVTFGVISARKPNSTTDGFFTLLGMAGYAVPVFWLGQLLILVFALQLGWLPAGGMVDLRASPEGWDRTLDIGVHLILPALALSVRPLALNLRITRSAMLGAMASDYVVTAKAKGLGQRVVLVRHALRNSLLSVVTVNGYDLGFMLSGSVLIETVFNWPGLGRLLFDSISARDFPVMMGIFLVASVTVVIANLVTDLLYAYLDPRIRY